MAERDGAVVGRLDLSRDSHPAAGHVAEVGLAVEPAARRSGVARTLLAAAERWARDAGITRLEAHATPLNGPALALLDRRGWRIEGFRPGRFAGHRGPVDVLLLGLDLT